LKYNQVTPIIPLGNNSHTTGLKGRPHARATFSGLEANLELPIPSLSINPEHSILDPKPGHPPSALYCSLIITCFLATVCSFLALATYIYTTNIIFQAGDTLSSVKDALCLSGNWSVHQVTCCRHAPEIVRACGRTGSSVGSTETRDFECEQI